MRRALLVLVALVPTVLPAQPSEVDLLVLRIRVTPREGLDPLINELVFLESPRAGVSVASLLGDGDPEVRGRAAYVLGFLADPATVAPLIQVVDDEDWEVRRDAIYALGRLDAERAALAVASRLGDPRREVRLESARTLARLKVRRTGPALRQALGAVGDDLELELALIAALGATGDRGAIPALERRLSSGSEAVRLAATQALAILGHAGARARLQALLGDPEPYVRRDAVRLLAELSDPWAARALASALEDADDGVRLAAAELLGLRGDERGLLYLVSMTDGDDARAALRAADALGRIGVGEARLAEVRRALREERRPEDEVRPGPVAPPALDPLAAAESLREAGAPFPMRLDALSALFRDVPYLESPLGEGAGIDPDPLYRWDAVDCLTYVEQVLALAGAPSRGQTLPLLLELRYSDGRVSYGRRNHLMMAQWIPNNLAKGLLRDVTAEVGGELVVQADKAITAEGWEKRRGVDLPLSAEEVPLGTHRLPIIPLARFAEVMARVPDGTLLIVVRKDIATRPYRVTHLGFVVRKEGRLFLRHAARSVFGRVVDERLENFLARNARYDKWPVEGFNLLLPLERVD